MLCSAEATSRPTGWFPICDTERSGIKLSIMWAVEFKDIPATLVARADLRARMHQLLAGNIPGKATEGAERLQRFRSLMASFIDGEATLNQLIQGVSVQLPRELSNHSGSNRVFATGWEERLVRTQVSRLYNQAALEALQSMGCEQCYVAHSSEEMPSSRCSRELAGRVHEIGPMLATLVRTYVEGNFTEIGPKIPEHPHCTHACSPVPK
jgi:hypothetical protein